MTHEPETLTNCLRSLKTQDCTPQTKLAFACGLLCATLNSLGYKSATDEFAELLKEANCR
jgi:hypothetical protein